MPRKRQQGGLDASVTQNAPDVKVKVVAGGVVVHEGEEYKGGRTLTMPGPQAMQLAMQGVVTVEGPE